MYLIFFSIFLISSFVLCHSTASNDPGLFLIINAEETANFMQIVTVGALALANNDTGTPSRSGSSGKISYTLSNFRYNFALDSTSPQYFFNLTSTESDSLEVAWTRLGFTITFNYHVCAHILSSAELHVCEHGQIVLASAGFEPTAGMAGNASFAFGVHQKHPELTVSGLRLVRPQDVEVAVLCGDSICAIPTHDIREAVVKEIPSVLTQAAAALNLASKQHLDHFTTSVPLPVHPPVYLSLEGSFSLYNENKGAKRYHGVAGSLVLAANGAVSALPTADSRRAQLLNGQKVNLRPGAPPTRLLNEPFTVIVTDRVPRTALLAAAQSGALNFTVDSGSEPAWVPFKLNTDSDVVLGFAPGLAKYPHRNISLTASPAWLLSEAWQPGWTTSSPTNVSIHLPMIVNAFLLVDGADQSLAGSSSTDPVFSLLVDVNVTAALSLATGGTALAVKLSSWSIKLVSLHSTVGQLNVFPLQLALQAALDFDGPQPAPIPFPHDSISWLKLAGFKLDGGQGFISLSASSISLRQPGGPVRTKACPAKKLSFSSTNVKKRVASWHQLPASMAGVCFSENSCCDGQCCALWQAKCCSSTGNVSWCCPSNWQCCSQGCCA